MHIFVTADFEHQMKGEGHVEAGNAAVLAGRDELWTGEQEADLGEV
jgi:hypothetical protein